MERLTKRENGHAHYPRCFEEPCGGMGCRDEDCKFKVEICERLAAYEDTGLTPQEVISMHGEWRAMMSVLNSIGGGYTRLRELAEADKNGRLVVLPCKVGTATYYIHYPIAVYPDESEPEIKRGIFTLCDLDRVGRSVFLTHEEAEKALEAMKK